MDTITRARARVEQFAEECLFDKNTANGAKFSLANNFEGWKEKWEELRSIEYDKELRFAIAEELLANKKLLEEVRAYPEKLIELFFIVVDKEKKTRPFFLNVVQREFIGMLNKAKNDFAAGLIPEISKSSGYCKGEF